MAVSDLDVYEILGWFQPRHYSCAASRLHIPHELLHGARDDIDTSVSRALSVLYCGRQWEVVLSQSYSVDSTPLCQDGKVRDRFFFVCLCVFVFVYVQGAH